MVIAEDALLEWLGAAAALLQRDHGPEKPVIAMGNSQKYTLGGQNLGT